VNQEALPGLTEALQGRYRLERELGRGGMGVVYLARELRLERQVALKVLPPDLARAPELRERFLREARTAAQLSHPNIVPIYHADETGGFAFFAMGFVDGETLADYIKTRGRLSPADAVRILREVAWALAYAHARGVIHRDIKPENVMLERATGRVLVTDFGIARDTRATSLTQEGHVLGSVHYMSPEQATGDAIDGRSDLYALGVIGFQALTGQLPFSAAAPGAVLVMHATKAAPRLREVAPDVPESLARVIDRALAKAPDERYPSGEALAAALAAAMADVSVTPAGGVAVDQVLSVEQAQAVWLRAAQLQMEAASRIEARSRKALLPDAPAGAVPTTGYRLADVAAAAAEVGIGDEFVALALAELPAPSAAPVLSNWEDRAATAALGSSQRSVSVSRVIRATPARVLEALGRISPGHPYQFTFVETQGGHPLDGGILLFDMPGFLSGTLVSPQGVSMFGYRMEQIELRRVQVRLHALAGDGGTEISIYGDLRPGVRANFRFSQWWTGGAGVIGGGIALTAAAKAGLAAAALALPVAGAVLAAGALGFVSYRYMFRHALKKAIQEMDGLLIAIDRDLRSLTVFGDRSA
jgi:predicted Ser/Thr protein kinase